MKWLVIANSNTCLIYEYKNHLGKLVSKVEHPENKLLNHEIGVDRPGRYKAPATPNSAFEPRTEPKEVIIETFAREIARHLNEARNHHSVDKLIMVMPAAMAGLVDKALNSHVKSLVTATIHKNVVDFSEKDLADFLDQQEIKM